jgi:hypothetical protein
VGVFLKTTSILDDRTILSLCICARMRPCMQDKFLSTRYFAYYIIEAYIFFTRHGTNNTFKNVVVATRCIFFKKKLLSHTFLKKI